MSADGVIKLYSNYVRKIVRLYEKENDKGIREKEIHKLYKKLKLDLTFEEL